MKNESLLKTLRNPLTLNVNKENLSNLFCHVSKRIIELEYANQWLSVKDPMTLADNDKVWALWDDGEVEIATYMGWACCFERKCGTDEGQHGWNGSVGYVTHYIPLVAPPVPTKGEKS